MKKILITTLAIVGLSTGYAFAQTAADGQAPDMSFSAADTDTSGDINLAEAQVLWPELNSDTFQAADTDKNGSWNEAEFDAYVSTTAPTPGSVVLAPDADSKPAGESSTPTTPGTNP